jgi:hypothetical protein
MTDDIIQSAMTTWAAKDLPVRLLAAQVAKLLNCTPEDVFILVTAGICWDEGWLGLGDHLSANEELEQITPELRAHPKVLALRLDIYWEAKNWEAVVHSRGKFPWMMNTRIFDFCGCQRLSPVSALNSSDAIPPNEEGGKPVKKIFFAYCRMRPSATPSRPSLGNWRVAWWIPRIGPSTSSTSAKSFVLPS